MLANEENTAAVVLAGLIALPFLLALVSVSLWGALGRPQAGRGHSQAAGCSRMARHARITGATVGIAGHHARGAAAIAAAQPMPREGPRAYQLADAMADPWAGSEDDTDLAYYDTSSGNIWRLDAPPRVTPRVL